jgi:transposase
MQAITIGLDLAKHWFQVHGVDAAGKIVVKRRLRRAEVVAFFRGQDPCLVGMEACATAHHWARELITLGHEVRLMPPAYVKAYVKRNKDVDQQAVLMMHRARNLLVRQRTMAVNALRAHLAEFGVVAPQGLRHVERLVAAIEENKAGLPELARSILRLIVAQLDDTQAKVRQIEARLAQWHRNSRLSRLLATVPGVGIMGASAIAATVSDPSLFRPGPWAREHRSSIPRAIDFEEAIRFRDLSPYCQ